MKNTVINFLEQVKQSRSRRHKAAAVLVCFSLVVVGGTAWALHINGESQTGETWCGYEEHQHSEACVEKVLICGYDMEGTTAAETEAPIHTHDESCYEEQTVLTCELEESVGHTHSEECYDADGNLICGMEESEGHTHSEESGCYTTEQVLVCGLEEGAPETTESATETSRENPTHVHTDECYEITYKCGFDYEHTHTLSCFSNPEADVETAADWEKAFANVELTGVYADDVLAIAKTQLGYTESAKNYQVVLDDEGNETTETKGYTRYGAWYGDVYGDWCAMFVSFCLNYAEVPTAAFPRDASCPNWIETISDPEQGYELYRDAADYSPYPGDLVFFDWDEDGEADHVGIVSELTPEYTGSEEYYEDDADYTLTGFKTIEGNSENKVKENEYELTDETILGYGALSTVVNDGTLAAYTEEDTANTYTFTINSLTHNYTDVDGVSQSWTGDITFTVTPPKDSEIDYSKYTLCAEEYSNGSAYASAIEAYVGVTNDIQYYNIFWKDSSGNTMALETGTTVKIKWDSNSCLYGTTQVGRIARVLPLNESTADGFIKDDEQPLVGLTKDDTEPTGFESITFTANTGSPYAIVSDRVSTGYIDALTVTVESDGTANFTTETDAAKLTADSSGMESNGCDTSAKNGVVRSFDSIAYKLNVTTASRSDESYSAETAKIYVEMSMDMGLTEAEFDLSQLKWAETEGASWLIEYLDANGDVVAIRDKDCGDGYVKLVTNGVTATATTSINDITNGSTAGNDSYKDTLSIKTQRLTGTYIKTGTGSNTAVPGTQDFSAGIKVLNAANGTVVEPTFRVWLDGNEENYGYENGTTNKSETVAAPQENSVELKELYNSNNTAYAVKVSAGAFYNVEVQKASYLQYLGWFDFTKGIDLSESTTNEYTVNSATVTGAQIYALLEKLGSLEENWGRSNPAEYTDNESVVSYPSGTKLSDYNTLFSNIRYGRMYGYGVGLSLANLSSNGDYGMKGLSLPKGDIGLDLQLNTNVTASTETVDTSQYYTILWDYKPNVSSTTTGNLGRTTKIGGIEDTHYGRATGPFNTGDNSQSCYNGGSWTLTKVDGNESTTTTTASTGDGGVYSFKVSGYDIDLNDYSFPTKLAGDGSEAERYMKALYPFSEGYAEVLTVIPRTQTGTVTDVFTLTAGNLDVTSTSNVHLSPTSSSSQTDKAVKYDYETNTSTSSNGQDNVRNETVVFYKPGTASKLNSFVKRIYTDANGNKKTYDSRSESDGFLGQTGTTDSFWTAGCDWDAAAFAGDQIAIMSDAWVSADSDAHISAMNILQLFDSKALSIDETLEETKSYNQGNEKVGYGTVKQGTVYGSPNRITVMLSSGSLEKGENGVTILYAADPDFKNGYDTNDKTTHSTDKGDMTIAKYMNYVQEEDLVYYTSLASLESDGYTCIGVLAEVRGCQNIINGTNGSRIFLRIPVKVDGNADLNNTVCTVNTARIWTTEGAMTNADGSYISWKNGNWNGNKNKVTGYQPIKQLTENGAAGENGFNLDNTEANYVKVEYADGTHTGHTNGRVYGNSLLILGYKAGIQIDSEKKSGNKTYDLSKESEVAYTLSGINTSLATDVSTSSSAVTNLTINVTLSGADSSGKELGEALDVLLLGEFQMEVPAYEKNEDGTHKTDDEGHYIPVYEKDENGNYVTDKDGNQVQATETVTFSKDDSVTVIVEYNDTCYPVTFSVTMGDGNQSATITVTGAPVGATLPNIILPASLGNGLPNGSSITATATISGSGDQRAYEEVNGNLSTDTVSIVRLGGSSLSKTVDTTLMELDGIVEYTITYTNDGETILDTAYFYDILPYNGDIRDTHYIVADSEEHNGTFLYNIEANSTKVGLDEDTGDFNGTLTFYYSTYGYNADGVNTNELKALREMLEGFSGQNEADVNDMLNDSNYFTELGTLVKDPDGTGGDTKFTLTKEILDKYDKNGDKDITEADDNAEKGWSGLTDFRKEILTKITCVYAKVENMGAKRSLNLKLSMRTQDNAGADVYGNVAWGWAPTMGSTLRSEIVRTYVVSRSISGVVWYDADLDGVKDDGEKTLDGVTCTLFKKNDNGSYEKCTTDVTGATISAVETKTDGAYSFTKLTAGEYVVAFKLNNKYASSINGATTYQVNKTNESNTNDGVALGTTASSMDTENVSFSGISSDDYDYAIAYSLSDTDMDLHSLEDYQTNASSLTYYSNYQENYVNQDLGLVYSIDYTLPKTGGTGTILFTVGGLLLITVTLVYGCGLRRKRERRAK